MKQLLIMTFLLGSSAFVQTSSLKGVDKYASLDMQKVAVLHGRWDGLDIPYWSFFSFFGA